MTGNTAPQDAPRVDPVDEPSALAAHIPVPTGGEFPPFGHPLTVQAIGRASMASGAVEEYARAQLAAPYTAPPWRHTVPETIAAFLEQSFEDARYRCRGTTTTTALMVPTWVVDHLAEIERPARASIIEIPMNPTAPVWHAVAIVAHDQRPPSLVHPRWQALAVYPCPALPAHLEAFAARQAGLEAGREHERTYAALGQSFVQPDTVRRLFAEPRGDEPRAPGDEPIITADPERLARQIRQDLYDAAHPEGGTDER